MENRNGGEFLQVQNEQEGVKPTGTPLYQCCLCLCFLTVQVDHTLDQVWLDLGLFRLGLPFFFK